MDTKTLNQDVPERLEFFDQERLAQGNPNIVSNKVAAIKIYEWRFSASSIERACSRNASTVHFPGKHLVRIHPS